MTPLFKIYLDKAASRTSLQRTLAALETSSAEELYTKCKEEYEQYKELFSKVKADYIKAAEEIVSAKNKEGYLYSRRMQSGICLYSQKTYDVNIYWSTIIEFMSRSVGVGGGRYIVLHDGLTEEERITKRIEKLNDIEEMFS